MNRHHRFNKWGLNEAVLKTPKSTPRFVIPESIDFAFVGAFFQAVYWFSEATQQMLTKACDSKFDVGSWMFDVHFPLQPLTLSPLSDFVGAAFQPR